MPRKLLAVYCIVSLALPVGCIRSTASEWRNSQARRAYHRASPEKFAPHVRPVSKVSQESPSDPPTRFGANPPPGDETDTLLRLVQEQPENAAALRRLADAYLKGGHFELARERYQALLELVATDPEIELALAQIHEKLGNDGLALRHAQLAVSLRPPRRETLEFLAAFHSRRKNYAKAVDIYEAALQLAPRRLSLLVSLAEAHLQLTQWREARRRLLEALEIDGSRRDVQRNLALAEMCLGETESAVRQLLSRGNGPEAFNQLGLSLMQLGQWRDARRVFGQALSLKPDYIEARVNFEDADSYLAPPRVVNLPGFDAVPDAAVNLAPVPSDPPRKSRASAEFPLAESGASMEGPAKAAPTQTTPQPELALKPPFDAASEKAADDSRGVEPIVFLRPQSEPTQTQPALEEQAASRQAQVTISSFEEPRSQDHAVVVASFEAIDSAGLMDTMRDLQDSPSAGAPEMPAMGNWASPLQLGSTAIFDLGRRKIVEAAMEMVDLPSNVGSEAKPSSPLNMLKGHPARPEDPTPSSQTDADVAAASPAPSRSEFEADLGPIFQFPGFPPFGASYPSRSLVPNRVQADPPALRKVTEVRREDVSSNRFLAGTEANSPKRKLVAVAARSEEPWASVEESRLFPFVLFGIRLMLPSAAERRSSSIRADGGTIHPTSTPSEDDREPAQVGSSPAAADQPDPSPDPVAAGILPDRSPCVVDRRFSVLIDDRLGDIFRRFEIWRNADEIRRDSASFASFDRNRWETRSQMTKRACLVY